MRLLAASLLAAACLLATASASDAASLQVSPVNVEVRAPGAASTITLQNLGDDVIDAQVRVFKWEQRNGKDELVPTTDVVASPPFVKMVGGKNYVVRIVRTTKTPVGGEESYRLLIDQIPKANANPGNAVNFAVRYSIPVFFSQASAQPSLSWAAEVSKGRLSLKARNEGERRVRISALKIVSNSGKTLSFGEGLAGYVLGQSANTWTAGGAKGIAPGSTITIQAMGDNGPIAATARVEASN